MVAVAADDPLHALRTLRDCIRWGASEFGRVGLVFGHGSDNALDDAFHLVLSTLKLPFDLPATYFEATLADDERAAVLIVLRERATTRKPTPYLTGEAWFCGLPFFVDERVLIPRSPIAELIEARFEPWLQREPEAVLDLCTGSGCIGIACAFAFEDARVDLAELDAGAQEVANLNVARHGLEDRVEVLGGDLFGATTGRVYDLIVSNPPYVPTAEWQALAAEYRHEPRQALDAGADGMDLVDRILRDAPDFLADEGALVCEIGGSRAEFEHRFAGIPVIWPEFARGGDGVFIIGRDELLTWLDAG